MIPHVKVIAAICAVMAVFLLGYGMGHKHATNAQQAHYEPILKQYAESAQQAEAKARQIEREAAQKVARASDEGLQRITEAEERHQAALRDLNAGAIRVRRELTTCRSRVPTTPGDPRVDHGAEESGFSPAVAGHLLRVGRDADRVAEQLSACQALLR